MIPDYLDGDIIIVQESCYAESGKDVVAFVNNQDGIKKSITIANPHPGNSVFPNYIKQIVKLMESIDIEKNQ